MPGRNISSVRVISVCVHHYLCIPFPPSLIPSSDEHRLRGWKLLISRSLEFGPLLLPLICLFLLSIVPEKSDASLLFGQVLTCCCCVHLRKEWTERKGFKKSRLRGHECLSWGVTNGIQWKGKREECELCYNSMTSNCVSSFQKEEASSHNCCHISDQHQQRRLL